MPTPISYWILFTGGVLVLLLLDLLVLRRLRPHMGLLESLATTAGWILLSAAFGLWILHRGGPARGLEFFTGYLIEYALSMDNIFIFVLIFTSFHVPATQQHRLLFWGVIGALIMRGILVGVGTALLHTFAWITYVFGAYILYAGASMLRKKEETAGGDKFLVRLVRRHLPLSQDNHSTGFIIRENGRLKFTVLFLVLIIIETTDLVFALDSVPAVFAVTRDPFIVYTSNICAILGLRSLYFLLAGAMKHLAYLHFGLAAVLIFIGAKMVGENVYPISTVVSLLVVGVILALTIFASLLNPKAPPQAPSS
jgi:tellurite resistance protein TerC